MSPLQCFSVAGVTKKTDRMVGCAPKGRACAQSLLTECLHNQITEDYGKCLLINGSKLRNNKPNGLLTFYSAANSTAQAPKNVSENCGCMEEHPPCINKIH